MGKTDKKKKHIKLTTIDGILIGCACFLIVFTFAILVIFILFQTEPDTLISSVFGLLGGEVTLSFAIWYIKKRYSHKFEREDKKDELEG